MMENKTNHDFTIFQHLKLTFESLDLESHSTCGYDAVKIYKPGQTDPLLVVCGDVCSPTLLLNSSAAHVVFETDRSQAGNGFRLRYETVSPSEYICSQNCYWSVDMLMAWWKRDSSVSTKDSRLFSIKAAMWCSSYIIITPKRLCGVIDIDAMIALLLNYFVSWLLMEILVIVMVS